MNHGKMGRLKQVVGAIPEIESEILYMYFVQQRGVPEILRLLPKIAHWHHSRVYRTITKLGFCIRNRKEAKLLALKNGKKKAKEKEK